MQSIAEKVLRETLVDVGRRLRPLLVPAICLALAAMTLAVFWRTMGFGFVNFDDGFYVYNNKLVRSGLSWKGLAWVFTHEDCSLYHPLTMLSLMWDYQLHGQDGGGYHVTNVLLHTGSVVLLFLVLRGMTGAIWRSAFVAAVFAIHPLRVESVAWVAERKDVLGTFFFMLTLWAYVGFVRKPGSIARYLLVAFLFTLALFSKPTVVTLPFVLLLLDYWPFKRTETAKKLVLEKIPLLALAIGACLMTMVGAAKEVTAYEHVSLFSRVCNALVSYSVYLHQMFWPAGLAAFYPRPPGGYPAAEVALSFLLLTLITLAAWFFRRERRWLLTGWLWYLGMLTPMIGLVQAGAFAHADRMTYLPQIGIYVALTWQAAEWLARGLAGRVAAGLLMPIIVAALAIVAWKQTAYWKDSETLWGRALDCTRGNFEAEYSLGVDLVGQGKLDEALPHYQNALKYEPNNAEAHNNLGSIFFQKGRTEDAVGQFQKAAELEPGYETAHYNLATALMQTSRTNEAIAEFEKALQIKPDNADAHYHLATALRLTGQSEEATMHYEKAEELDPGLAGAVFNSGNDLYQTGKPDDAIAQYEEALRLNPQYAEADVNLANVLLVQGRTVEAIEHLKEAVRIDPNSAQAQNDLANALLKEGNLAEAISHFEEAVKLAPDDPWVKNNLSWLLAAGADASRRDGKRAVELAAQANDLTGGVNPIVLHTLAAAQAEAGQFSNAVETAGQALHLADGEGKTGLAAHLQEELKLYREGQAFHETN